MGPHFSRRLGPAGGIGALILACLIGAAGCADGPTHPNTLRPPQISRHWIGHDFPLEPSWRIVGIETMPSTMCYTLFTSEAGAVQGCGNVTYPTAYHSSHVYVQPGGDPWDYGEITVLVMDGPGVPPGGAINPDTLKKDTSRADVPCVQDSFPNDSVIADSAVQAMLAPLWTASEYADANGLVKPLADRKEHGGFIIRTGNTYTFQPFPSTWNADACGIDVDTTYAIPTGTVAFIHTHPFTAGETTGPPCPPSGYDANNNPIYGVYNNEPSDFSGDRRVSFNWDNLPGYILDANKVIRFNVLPILDYKSSRCAY
jgi:hypothetical protein